MTDQTETLQTEQSPPKTSPPPNGKPEGKEKPIVAGVHIRMPPDVHRRLKAACAARGESMQTFVLNAARDYIAAVDAYRQVTKA